MTDKLAQNEILCRDLAMALEKGEGGLRQVPMLVKLILEKDSWRERRIGNSRKRVVRFERFEDFVREKPLEGLGEDPALLLKVVRASGDVEAETLLDAALKRPAGRPKGRAEIVDIINDSRPTGTSRDAALRRLRKDAPELHERVVAGEVTPHRAMVLAGFRKEPSPLERAKKAVLRLSEDELAEFLEWVKGARRKPGGTP